ncbi:MAG: 4a-hydroxytetrahydrobiopterin dehydratase [Isosphaeraceae bacterium]
MSTGHDELARRTCRACEGGVEPMKPEEIARDLAHLPGWQVTDDGRRIRRSWNTRNFGAAMAFLNRVAELAESEGHHPDLHLDSYRHVTIELTTHAISGLSENDMILAAKIDELPVELRRGG